MKKVYKKSAALLIMLCMILTVVPSNVSAMDAPKQDLTESDIQFDDSSELVMYGDAERLSDGTIQLTDLDIWQSGSAWYSHQIKSKSGFKTTFSYWAGGGRNLAYGGADGIVLTFSPETGLGSHGEDLGFVKGAFGVELDSYHNAYDPEGKHIAILKDSTRNHLTYRTDARVDDSEWHTLTVTYSEDLLTVYLDDEKVLSKENIFLPDEFYLGISAATGAGRNKHLIKDFIFEGNASAGSSFVEDNCPIIIVPGVMGSRLYDGDNQVWSPTVEGFNLDKYLQMTNELSVRNNYDDNSVPLNQALLSSENREYGATDIYKGLVEGILTRFENDDSSYSRGVYFFSYDFRKSSAQSAMELDKYIQAILENNSEYRKVDIVAHSMGGLVMSGYVSKFGTENINKIITVGTPYEGAPKLENSVLTKEVLDNSFKNYFFNKGLFLLGLNTSLKASFPALAELAPTRMYFDVKEKKFMKYIGEGIFAYLDYEGYWEINDRIFGINNQNAINFHNSIKDVTGLNVLLGMENSYFAVGINQKTIDGIVFNLQGTSDIKVWSVRYDTNGDGTVPYESATMIQQLESLPKERVGYFDTTHTGLVQYGNKDNIEGTKAVNWILDILSFGKSDITNDVMEKKDYIVIRVACPVDVVVKKDGELLNSDLQNLSAETSFGVLDLLGENAEIKMMCLDDDDYEVLLHGTGEGTMDYTVSYFDVDGNLKKELEFTDVLITNDMMIHTGTNQSELILHVDMDNDGAYDYEILPDGCEQEEKLVKISDTSYRYTESPIEIYYDIIPHYGTVYQANVTVKNISDETIHNWEISFDLTDEITSIWNGTATNGFDGIVVKNAQYNQDIRPGETISFGFIASGNETIQIPGEFALLNTESVTSQEQYDIIYTIDAENGTGYNASITITNISDRTLEDWKLEFDFEDEIANLWNAQIISHENGHYVVENADYNQNIEPGQSVVIGLIVEEGSIENMLENTILYNINGEIKQ